MGDQTLTVWEYRMERMLAPMRRLNATTLKLLAIAAMVCDHFAAGILVRGAQFGWITPENPTALDLPYQLLRSVGRMAFPIFAYFIVEGFLHTHSWQRYLAKLFLFAVLSELPFDLFLFGEVHWQYQNVFFTLAAGLVMLELFVKLPERQIPILLFFCLLSWMGKFDYYVVGMVLFAVFFWLRNRRVAAILAGAVSFLWEPFSLLGFALLLFYNGKRGRGMKYFFYLFYPLHFLLLYFLWKGLCFVVN